MSHLGSFMKLQNIWSCKFFAYISILQKVCSAVLVFVGFYGAGKLDIKVVDKGDILMLSPLSA